MALPPKAEDTAKLQKLLNIKVDGDFGNGTKNAVIEYLRHLFDKTNKRAIVVQHAVSQLGKQDPDKYWNVVCPALKGQPTKISWCGGFALWCLRQAGLCDWSWVIGKGFASAYLPITKTPEPGDIAYFDKPFQHHAIVESNVNGTVTTIDGNQEGETVQRRTRKLADATAYYSIKNIVT